MSEVITTYRLTNIATLQAPVSHLHLYLLVGVHEDLQGRSQRCGVAALADVCDLSGAEKVDGADSRILLRVG